MKERIKLKKDKTIDAEMKLKIEERIKQIEEEIGNTIFEDYHKDIMETIKEFGGDETSLDGSGRNKLWKCLKKKFPNIQSRTLARRTGKET